MVAGHDHDHRQADPLPHPSVAPLGRLLELEKARMDIAKSKLADLKIKLTAHKTREEAARAHRDYLIASTSACQELYKAVEEDYQHAALCTALAEKPKPAEIAHPEISEELRAVPGAEGHIARILGGSDAQRARDTATEQCHHGTRFGKAALV